MVTLLDCIERIPHQLEAIIQNRHERFAGLFSAMEGHLEKLDEIVFIGSGTSNTAAITSKFFVEKVTGIRTTAVYPNDFYHNTYYYNPNALYVFISQTGTSLVVRNTQKMIKEKGFLTICISENSNTPLATETPVFVDMGCGVEEHLTRTIGYTTSVFTNMIMGLEIGFRRGNISQAQYEGYIDTAKKVPGSHRDITVSTMKWMDTAKRQMMRSRCLIFTGADALQGVALEAAVKVWEIPQYISIGYELEEGLHGANFGYDYNHCVIVLNHGGRENDKALGLARWMKDVFKNGLVIGSEVVDETDLKIDLVGGDFDVLEFAPVIQVISHRLALDEGRDMNAPRDRSVMRSYFTTR